MSHDLRLDFLRILAVILVLIHHLFPIEIPNGYVGVDIFMVIAGYLAIFGIAKHKEWRKYIFARFNRIYPEYYILLFLNIPLGYFILTNQRLKDFGSTLSAAPVSMINILFSLKKDYAYGLPDVNANPLMHLWSISLEMQFYLVASLCIFFLNSLKSRFTLPIIIIASISFIFFLRDSYSQSSHYLLPYRMWEFCAGMLVAMFSVNRFELRSQSISRLLFLFLLCSITILSLSNTSFFYGFRLQILIVTLTALTLILTRSEIANETYAHKITERIGRATFPIYLTHYPAIVFASLASQIFDVSFFLLFIVLFFSLTILVLLLGSYFRKMQHFRLIILFLTFIFLIGGFYFWKEPAAGQRFYINGLSPAHYIAEGERDRKDGICNTTDESQYPLGCTFGNGDTRIALIGDSFGAALASGFYGEDLTNRYQLLQFTKNGCPLTFSLVTHPDRKCAEFNQALLKELRRVSPDIILVQYRWWSYAYRTANYNVPGANGYVYCPAPQCTDDQAPKVDEALISTFIDAVTVLKKYAPYVIVVSPTPEYEEMIPESIGFVNTFRKSPDGLTKLRSRKVTQELSGSIYRQMTKLDGINGADIGGAFYSEDGKFFAQSNSEVLFYDTNHLSKYGANIAWQKIDQNLSRLNILTKNN